MTTSLDQTDSPKLRPRPFSQPIDQDALSGGGLRHELVDIWSQRCAFVVDEILQTEQDYVNALDDIIQGYRVPLVTRLKSSSETQKLINSLFGNIDELHGLHMSLLRKLQAHDIEPHEFGQVFIRTEDGFKLYIAYCTNYTSSMLCLQQLLMSEKHNQFLDQCQRNLKHSLPLSAQLIKPVQRIMRYHLLLHELVKHFNPNHYGYPSLKQAHKTMAKIADHINKVKKKEENERRVKHLQTSLYGWKGNDAQDNLSVYGELLLESTCQVGTKKGTERQVLLFEKLLLILKKKDTKRYNYKAHIVASELCLEESQSSANHTCFWIYSRNRRQIKYLIDLRSNSKRTEWVNTINDLTRKFSQDLEEEYGQFRGSPWLKRLFKRGGLRKHKKKKQQDCQIWKPEMVLLCYDHHENVKQIEINSDSGSEDEGSLSDDEKLEKENKGDIVETENLSSDGQKVTKVQQKGWPMAMDSVLRWARRLSSWHIFELLAVERRRCYIIVCAVLVAAIGVVIAYWIMRL